MQRKSREERQALYGNRFLMDQSRRTQDEDKKRYANMERAAEGWFPRKKEEQHPKSAAFENKYNKS
jgi:hypothetical protein